MLSSEWVVHTWVGADGGGRWWRRAAAAAAGRRARRSQQMKAPTKAAMMDDDAATMVQAGIDLCSFESVCNNNNIFVWSSSYPFTLYMATIARTLHGAIDHVDNLTDAIESTFYYFHDQTKSFPFVCFWTTLDGFLIASALIRLL